MMLAFTFQSCNACNFSFADDRVSINFFFFMFRIRYPGDFKILEVFNYTLNYSKQQSGQFKWKVPSTSKDYVIRTFVYDSHGCGTGYPLNITQGKNNLRF